LPPIIDLLDYPTQGVAPELIDFASLIADGDKMLLLVIDVLDAPAAGFRAACHLTDARMLQIDRRSVGSCPTDHVALGVSMAA
jgi:hypothetical protein